MSSFYVILAEQILIDLQYMVRESQRSSPASRVFALLLQLPFKPNTKRVNSSFILRFATMYACIKSLCYNAFYAFLGDCVLKGIKTFKFEDAALGLDFKG